MKMPRDFCSGYTSAVADLEREGDNRCADWSAPYEYLKERLNTIEPIGETLVEQLRYRGGICVTAANDIERLRAALKQIADDDPSGKWGRWAREALAQD